MSFFVKVSQTRTWIINEYWVFIPLGISIELFLFYRRRKKKQKLRKVEDRNRQIDKICYLATRGGDYVSTIEDKIADLSDKIIDVREMKDCMRGKPDGLYYLDNKRIRDVVLELYYKKYGVTTLRRYRSDVIYVTTTAICTLAQRYGTVFLSFPIIINDSFGITSLFEFGWRATAVALGVISVRVLVSGPTTFVGIILQNLIPTLAVHMLRADLRALPVSYIGDESTPANAIKSRTPPSLGKKDVVIVNFDPSPRGNLLNLPGTHSRLTMPKMKPSTMSNSVSIDNWEDHKCLVPGNLWADPQCYEKAIAPINVADAVHMTTKADVDPKIVNQYIFNVAYDDMVNMKDVTNLSQKQFSDILDARPKGSAEKLTKSIDELTKPVIQSSKVAKQVNFLDKFADGVIDVEDTWEVESYSPKYPSNREIVRDMIRSDSDWE